MHSHCQSSTCGNFTPFCVALDRCSGIKEIIRNMYLFWQFGLHIQIHCGTWAKIIEYPCYIVSKSFANLPGCQPIVVRSLINRMSWVWILTNRFTISFLPIYIPSLLFFTPFQSLGLDYQLKIGNAKSSFCFLLLFYYVLSIF